MQSTDPLDLSVAIVALLIAVWGQMLSSATNELEKWDRADWKMGVGSVVFIGGVGIMIALFGGIGAGLLTLEPMGSVLVYLLLGALLLSLPHVLKLGKIAFFDPHNELGHRKQTVVLFAALLVLVTVVIVTEVVG